jgi:hypothetical protein
VICHQVNTLGVMGAGLALKIREKWPVVWSQYSRSVPSLGDCQIVPLFFQRSVETLVANLAGQAGVGRECRQTNYGALSSALYHLREATDRLLQPGTPIYFPHGMGCGLAGGDWNIVSELIEFYFPDAVICQWP